MDIEVYTNILVQETKFGEICTEVGQMSQKFCPGRKYIEQISGQRSMKTDVNLLHDSHPFLTPTASAMGIEVPTDF